MDNVLKKEIVSHILKNFGLNSENHNLMSINDKSFMISEKIDFEEGGIVYKNDVFGCQCSLREQKFKVIYTCLFNGEDKETFVYVKLDENPAYCIYSGFEDCVYFSPDKSEIWNRCTPQLYFTFGAALESIKDIYPSFNLIKDYKSEFDQFSKAINKINEQ